ncbi:uncharacterized protein LOC144711159 [Wolffia australiana]
MRKDFGIGFGIVIGYPPLLRPLSSARLLRLSLSAAGMPIHVTRLRRIEYLDLRYNGFSSKLPPSIFDPNIRKLQFLFVNNNPFNTRLPDNVGETRASYITLANNGFTGSIPSSIGKAKDTLIEIIFLNNRLSGCLPYEIGLLKRATLFDAGS